MSRFHYRLAYIGGSAKLWGCEKAFDGFAEKACNRMSEIGAMVHMGIELWEQLEMSDKLHTKSISNNKAVFADMVVRHLKELPLYHMEDMSLPELDET
eukprot:12162620-Karenia_brevis.AAC.1